METGPGAWPGIVRVNDSRSSGQTSAEGHQFMYVGLNTRVCRLNPRATPGESRENACVGQPLSRMMSWPQVWAGVRRVARQLARHAASHVRPRRDARFRRELVSRAFVVSVRASVASALARRGRRMWILFCSRFALVSPAGSPRRARPPPPTLTRGPPSPSVFAGTPIPAAARRTTTASVANPPGCVSRGSPTRGPLFETPRSSPTARRVWLGVPPRATAPRATARC